MTPRDAAKSSYRPSRVNWPAASAADVSLARPAALGAVGAKVRVGKTPVWVQPVVRTNDRAGSQRVGVRLLDRAAATAAGIDGVLFSLTPEQGAAGAGTVRVGIDYANFAEAYGGNYGSRLRMVRLPACALTTPNATVCRTAESLPSSNDPASQTVATEIQMTGSTTAEAVVMAAVASAGDEGGKGGTYAATDLKPAGSWTGGGSNGSFSYSYPVTVPPAASDLVPAVALSYDSSGVDGQTASTNAQASWAGDGWSTPRSYVEQTFVSCQDDPGGKASPVKTYDRCYTGPILTLSLNGSSSALVWDADKEVWKPESDNGSVITRVTNSNNGSGTYHTDYWRVTQRDGTVYEFGRNRLPGWSAGKAETKSVDHTPVYSPHSGDPCYNSAGFSSSVCTMAYRWNLDYVTDLHGNAMAYYYKQATNYYGRNKGATDVSYVRDSWLERIDYGFTDGGAYGTPPNQVVFATGPRCVAATCEPLNSSTKANWPDVPYDLVCNQGTDCDDWSPAFFSTVRLTSITTQQYNTATSAYEPVDSHALAHTMPPTGDGTSPTLWLTSITRTGHDTSAGGSASAIALPSVSFTGIKLANRVDAVTGGLPAFYRQRIETITTETGSVITASYELPQPCTAPVSLDPATNTRSCYPVYWTPDGYTAQFRDWFNKYAVTRVTSTDPTGGAPALSSNYEYLDGAAWRYDENEVVKAKYRTYGQFRGYAKVRTRNGDGVNDRKTLSEAIYYRGMSKNNNTTVVNVTDSAGGVHEDHEQLAGRELETTTHLGDGGPVDSSTITSYWISPAVASRARTGLPALTATWVEPIKTYSRQAVTGGEATTWRYTETDQSYDADPASATFGLLKHTYTHTVPTDAAYDQCTSLTYAAVNIDRNLVGLVSQTETVAVACGGFTQGTPASVPGSVNTLTAPASVDRPAQVVKHERTYYDDDEDFDTTFPQATAPAKGDVTMTRVAAGWSSGAYSYQTDTRSTYDSYGRVVDAYDAIGNKDTTVYTMNAVGLTTGTSDTNPLEHETSTTISPRRGLTLTTTDANGVVARQQYDALGRVTSVWLNSRATTTPANHKFTYTVSKTGVTGVTTEQLTNEGKYRSSVTIYDALLRPRQTQATTPQAGRMITDTFYDTRGWTRATYNGWWDPVTTPVVGAPATAVDLVEKVPNQTFNTYDGLGRAVISAAAKNGVTVSTTTTVYNGDRTTVIPPVGGVVKSTVTDPLGRTKELHEYSVLPTLNTPTDTFTGIFTVTGGTATISRYGYDQRGNQTTLTDAQGNIWTSTYDLLGRLTSKDDPDAGGSSMVYDANGNVVQSTDARNKTISYIYDALNRKTGEYAATVANQSAANQRAKWVYDNADNAVANMTYPIGQLTTTTAYSGGQAYTTQQKGFDVFGNSLGTTVTVPQSEGLLGGSYVFGHSYTSTLGLPLKDTYPAKGSLPAETVTHGYTPLDLPRSLGGLAPYTQNTSYDAWGRVTFQALGGPTTVAGVTNTYDDHTGRLIRQLVDRPGTPTTYIDDQHYKYDLAGNVIKKTSTRLGASTPSETQCYGYDGLARLTEAWTATDDCAVVPTAGNRSMVGNAIGGGSAYWTSWSIDVLGNRTQQVERNLAGGADTVTTYSYDGNGGGQPHTLTGTSTTGGETGSTSYAYDAAGNTTSRNAGQGNQTLAWNEAGKLTSITGGTGGDSSFVYNADGEILLQREPGKTTLYLPGQQLTLDTAANTVSGSRYYALPGGGTCIRSGSGSDYTFAIADHQGTPSLYLDSTGQNPTWRQYTPYGAARGADGAYPDNRGFLNKPMSPSGLTIVGARAYDPEIGRFISVDPLQDTGQPQQWNGYSYTNNTPVTLSDPTGMIPADCRDHDCYGYSAQALKKNGGGCKYGCGTTKNKEWGKKNRKTSTKAKQVKARWPKVPATDLDGKKRPDGRGGHCFLMVCSPLLGPSVVQSRTCIFTWCIDWSTGDGRDEWCWDCTLQPIAEGLTDLKTRAVEGLYGEVSVCFLACVAVQANSDGVFLNGGGHGCCKVGGTLGVMSAPPAEQQGISYGGCLVYYVGACYAGGERKGSGPPDRSYWHGGGIGVGAGAGYFGGGTFWSRRLIDW
ncbi:RHS repeat domain-containing protein [Micromonospora polyrhachis]|uniref:RHS repeat domain-containing protein n=1 Tax=Micromonospora polyrhachis TaxID=1282883 RepID=UPI0028AAAD1E|nr:RHS repeat-associated core domain-containing protein [Micromonospora polyrhachis]